MLQSYMGFDKCIVTCIHYCIMAQNRFMTVKTPLCFACSTPGNHDLFTVAALLTFQECQAI